MELRAIFFSLYSFKQRKKLAKHEKISFFHRHRRRFNLFSSSSYFFFNPPHFTCLPLISFSHCPSLFFIFSSRLLDLEISHFDGRLWVVWLGCCCQGGEQKKLLGNFPLLSVQCKLCIQKKSIMNERWKEFWVLSNFFPFSLFFIFFLKVMGWRGRKIDGKKQEINESESSLEAQLSTHTTLRIHLNILASRNEEKN